VERKIEMKKFVCYEGPKNVWYHMKAEVTDHDETYKMYEGLFPHDLKYGKSFARNNTIFETENSAIEFCNLKNNKI
jgi:hypothetical protein